MFKKLNLLVVALVAVSFVSVVQANQQQEKCIKRVKEACKLSNNDAGRIRDNVRECKQVQNGKDTSEAFLLRESGNVLVYHTGGNECAIHKYSMGRKSNGQIREVKDLLVIQGKKGEGRFDGSKLFMLSDDGRVYIMDQDGVFYELKNSKDQHYTDVTDIKGVKNMGDTINLEGATFDAILTRQDIEKRFKQGKVEKQEFTPYTTNQSPFHDKDVTEQGRPVNGW